jgi:predicted nucleotidyltransferase component of viral defense system
VTRYRDAVGLRRALETRLKQRAEANGTDLGRLRRNVVFDRVAARLASAPGDPWILKGGAAMEFRLAQRARMTKDLDVVLKTDLFAPEDVREVLIDCLAEDRDGDGFTFRVGPGVALAADRAERPAWRLSVDAWLAGKQFGTVRLDIALRSAELAGTEKLRLPGTLSFADIPVGTIEAVDRRQHFAEKLHALTREYPDRANTRIKDLVDLVLLIETGLIADSTLTHTVRHVFTVRATHPYPGLIPDPPESWRRGYPAIAAGLTRTPAELAPALTMLRAFWAAAQR